MDDTRRDCWQREREEREREREGEREDIQRSKKRRDGVGVNLCRIDVGVVRRSKSRRLKADENNDDDYSRDVPSLPLRRIKEGNLICALRTICVVQFAIFSGGGREPKQISG